MADERLRKHQTEAVDVRFRPDIAAEHAELLGRDVVGVAREAVADDRADVLPDRTGDAEIDDLGAHNVVARQLNVVRRDLTVDDPKLVRRLQARSEPALQDEHLIETQGPALEDLREGAPLDELHREIGAAEDWIDREDIIADDRLVVEIV